MWILIIWLTNTGVTTQEFSSREHREIAAKAFKNANLWNAAICTEK